jgi:hypothetical protein
MTLTTTTNRHSGPVGATEPAALCITASNPDVVTACVGAVATVSPDMGADGVRTAQSGVGTCSGASRLDIIVG